MSGFFLRFYFYASNCQIKRFQSELNAFFTFCGKLLKTSL
jgi:hypothetical protein